MRWLETPQPLGKPLGSEERRQLGRVERVRARSGSSRRRRHPSGRPSCSEVARSLRRLSRPGGGGRWTGRGLRTRRGGGEEDAFSFPQVLTFVVPALWRIRWWGAVYWDEGLRPP